jgi:hypothetical protein
MIVAYPRSNDSYAVRRPCKLLDCFHQHSRSQDSIDFEKAGSDENAHNRSFINSIYRILATGEAQWSLLENKVI